MAETFKRWPLIANVTLGLKFAPELRPLPNRRVTFPAEGSHSRLPPDARGWRVVGGRAGRLGRGHGRHAGAGRRHDGRWLPWPDGGRQRARVGRGGGSAGRGGASPGRRGGRFAEVAGLQTARGAGAAVGRGRVASGWRSPGRRTRCGTAVGARSRGTPTAPVVHGCAAVARRVGRTPRRAPRQARLV